MLPLTEIDVQTGEAIKQVVHSIITDTVPHAISPTDIQAATRKDKELRKLIPLIQAGNHRACKSDPDLAMCALVFRELSYTEGVVTRGHTNWSFQKAYRSASSAHAMRGTLEL